jgi:hypothetical protein
MKDITRLPDSKLMELGIITKGHSFGASVFHVLRMCTGVRILLLTLIGPTSNEVILSVLCLSDTWYIFLGTPRLQLLVALLDALLQIISVANIWVMYLPVSRCC